MRRKHNASSCSFKHMKCAVCVYLKKDARQAESHNTICCLSIQEDKSILKKVLLELGPTKFREQKILKFSDSQEQGNVFSDEEVSVLSEDNIGKVQENIEEMEEGNRFSYHQEK